MKDCLCRWVARCLPSRVLYFAYTRVVGQSVEDRYLRQVSVLTVMERFRKEHDL